MSVEIITPVLLITKAGTEEVAKALVKAFLEEHGPDYEQDYLYTAYVVTGRTET